MPLWRCGRVDAEGTPIAPAGHFPLEGGSKSELRSVSFPLRRSHCLPLQGELPPNMTRGD